MKKNFLFATAVLVLAAIPACLTAQQNISFENLDFWQDTKAKNWRIAAGIDTDIFKADEMTTQKGKGVLVNIPDEKNRANLISVAEYGDCEVSFDFTMAMHSNSGFYLQGRYEVQLLDSWGHQDVNFGDCGGVFARRKYAPQEVLFDGHAPRMNAALAPGLWQKMDIKFQAPRFDAAGKKIQNAVLLFVKLNGVMVQENVNLTGPTGGPISEKEVTKGPFMIQGDHGPVAFRNMIVKETGNTMVKHGPVSWEVIYGDFREISEFEGQKPDLTGTSEVFTWEVAKKENGFATRYKTQLNIPVAGEYQFILQAGGNSAIRVNGKELLEKKWEWSGNTREARTNLPVGSFPLDLLLYKMDGWMPPMLALTVIAPDGGKTELHAFSSTLALTPANPIYLDAPQPKVFRSFMDYQENGKFVKRIVHGVHVGDPQGMHYTYDLDNGALAQIWKGEFLNTSPMWDNRGDGSSRPRGAVLALGDIPLMIDETHLMDTSFIPAAAAGFRTLGYDLDKAHLPVFRYQYAGTEVNDQIRIVEGKYFKRSLHLDGPTPAGTLYYRVASADYIDDLGKGMFAIGDRQYYIRIPQGEKPLLKKMDGKMALFLAVNNDVTYDLIW